MLTYELALKLKEAGFPQDTNMKHYHATYGLAVGIPHPGTLIDPDVVAIPNLSELIEACGDDLFGIIRGPFNNGWEAGSDWSYDHLSGKVGHGSTPEEAVARLWIELNKK